VKALGTHPLATLVALLGACADPAAGAADVPRELAPLVERYAAEFPRPGGVWTGIGATSPFRRSYAERERELLAALRERPDDGEAHLELGVIYTGSHEIRRGMSHLLDALRALPARGEVWLWMGANRLAAGEDDEALRLLDHAAELAPGQAQIPFYRGQLHARAGDLAAAVGAYRRAVALEPTLVDARIELGACLEDLGELEAARAELVAAREVAPDAPELLFRLARIERARGDEAAARELETLHERATILDDMGALDDGTPPDGRHVRLGHHFLRARRHAEALREFEAALELGAGGSTRFYALLGRAQSLLALARKADARAAIDELRRYDPENDEIARLEAELDALP